MPDDRIEDPWPAGGAMTAVELYSARRRAAPLLERVAFKTPRLGEFCSQRELVAQTGQAIEDWPLVILKELVDNALDECEEARIAPEVDIMVSTETGEISITDNGRGIPAPVVRDVLDYSYRVSSREAYVSPTRGAQGNALKTLFAMPFALYGKTGTVAVEAQGVRHTIRFGVDQLRQRPAIDHEITPLTAHRKGTHVTVFWPDSACSIVAAAEARFLQIADDFGWINPHLRIRVSWNGLERVNRDPSDLAWEKWRACDPTSAHWYDLARLERYNLANKVVDLGLRLTDIAGLQSEPVPRLSSTEWDKRARYIATARCHAGRDCLFVDQARRA
jgi:hypothetical protein